MELSSDWLAWQHWVGNISYIILAASYLVVNMVWLRTLAIVSVCAEIVYFYVGGDSPLWVGIAWSFVFILINVVQLAVIYREYVLTRLSPEEQDLREKLFPLMANRDFHYLLKTGRRQRLDPETVLIRQGEKPDAVFVLLEGPARIEVNGQLVATALPGTLLGEASFVRDQTANASVVAAGPLEVLRFERDRLRQLLRKEEGLRFAFNELMSRNLADKLTEAHGRRVMA